MSTSASAPSIFASSSKTYPSASSAEGISSTIASNTSSSVRIYLIILTRHFAYSTFSAPTRDSNSASENSIDLIAAIRSKEATSLCIALIPSYSSAMRAFNASNTEAILFTSVAFSRTPKDPLIFSSAEALISEVKTLLKSMITSRITTSRPRSSNAL